MANYSALIAAINAAIKSNNKREITGPVLNAVLQATVSAFAQGYQFKGMATPSGTPEASDGKVFYIASTAGTYTNYGGAVVAADEVALLYLNGTWSKETLVNLAGFYKKPASGIPSTDMTAAVRASLAKADKAPQIRETYEEDLSDDESKYDDIWDLEVGASRDVTDTTWLNADVAIYHRDFDKFTVNRLSIGFEDDNSHRIYEFVENWGNPSRYYHWMDDGEYYTITRLPDLESTGNKVTSLSSVSTDAQYPSAKCVYDGLAGKQPTISDLATIRSGAALGATALQSVPNTYRTSAAQDVIDGSKANKPISELHVIAVAGWSALASQDPFAYSASVTIDEDLGTNDTLELINDNAVAFANYGFAIGAIDGQTATIYAIDVPTAAVTLKFNVIH